MQSFATLTWLLRLPEMIEQEGDRGSADAFRGAFEDWLFSGESLEKALGFGAEGRGKPNIRRQYLDHQRDLALRAAYGVCTGETPSQRVRILVNEIDIYQRHYWRLWRTLGQPPEGTSDLRRHLFIAHHYGVVPTSEKRLREIVIRRTGISEPRKPNLASG